MIRRRERIWLLLWIAGMIFPMAVLARVSPFFHRLLNGVLAPDWVHMVMHVCLFAILVIFMQAAFNLSPGKRSAGLMLLMLLVVAFVQESLQALNLGYLPIGGALFDLLVDLVGGCAGFVWTHFHHRISAHTEPVEG